MLVHSGGGSKRPCIVMWRLTRTDNQVHTFGRLSSSDTVLNCKTIPRLLSRSHAKLRYHINNDSFSLEDNNTTNGTYINQIKIPHGIHYSLKYGDEVSFGGPVTVVHDEVGIFNPFVYLFKKIPEVPLFGA